MFRILLWLLVLGATVPASPWSAAYPRHIPLDSVWVVNEEHRAIDGAVYEARLRGQGREVLVGSSRAEGQIPADAVVDLPGLHCTLPADVAPGAYELVLTLKQGEKVLSENSYPLRVVE
jgi:hypothetical protein